MSDEEVNKSESDEDVVSISEGDEEVEDASLLLLPLSLLLDVDINTSELTEFSLELYSSSSLSFSTNLSSVSESTNWFNFLG